MAPLASPVPRLDASVVDPATVAYLRDLVGALQGKCFHLACENQLTGAATDDLFRLRPEPTLLHGVPAVVASAIKTLEGLLRKCASQALIAYARHEVRLKRSLHEEKLAAAMADLESLDEVVVDQYDVFRATRAQVQAARHAKQRILHQIAAVVDSPDGSVEALASLLPRLGRAHETEAELEMSLWRTIHNFDILAWHTEIAKARVEAAEAALQVYPVLPDYWPDADAQLVRDAAARFEESEGVLRRFMAP
uniref:Uncharacterized protein n=1 Tax=Oryza brachyantha TaxID=4533 RepID=J3NDM5_ORYBR